MLNRQTSLQWRQMEMAVLEGCCNMVPFLGAKYNIFSNLRNADCGIEIPSISKTDERSAVQITFCDLLYYNTGFVKHHSSVVV